MRLLLALPPLVCLLAAPAEALTPDDRQALASALLTIRSAHDDDAARTAAAEILDDPERLADPGNFFAQFASAHSLTTSLSRFLGDRALRAGTTGTQRTLQEALARVAVREIEAVLRAHLPDRFGPEVAADLAWLEHLRSSMELLGRIAFEGDLSRESRREHYERLRGLVASYPDLLRQNASLDLAARSELGAIRAQLYKHLQDLLVPFDRERFIADAGFSGDYADLVRNHGVLVLDNNGLDARQRRAIRDVLALIPPSLYRLYHISVNDLFRNRAGETVEMSLAGSPGVNIFAAPVGSQASNDFPGDIDPVTSQGFCVVLQHEMGHVVDSQAISGDPSLSRRRAQLIAQAGDQPAQYLRSMFEPGFFVAHPQEFFASMANEYFSDSFHTLLLAVQRFDAGWQEPINQFLFFAEVYSQGRDSTTFVVQNDQCEYSLRPIPVSRDKQGRINGFDLPGSTLRFELDDAGNVVR